jgi:hypothetical protein
MSLKYEVACYRANDLEIELRAEPSNETIWATQKQIGEMFGIEAHTVTFHIKNVFRQGELDEVSVTRRIRARGADGKVYNTLHYNLDVILAVGYKVNSAKAVLFRRWASKILGDYVLKGVAVNPAIFTPKDSEQLEEIASLLRDKDKAEAELSARDRAIIGGIHKNITTAAVREIKQEVKAGIAALRAVAEGFDTTRTPGVEYRPMIDVLIDHGVPKPGRGTLSRICSTHCKAFLSERGILGTMTRRSQDHRKVWLFHVEALTMWLRGGGISLIRPEPRNQTVLPFPTQRARRAKEAINLR